MAGAKREALETVLEHLRHLWRHHVGILPTDADLRSVLRFVRVETLAVGEGEADEIAAKNMLRSHVLEDPGQTDQAWNALKDFARRLITERGSTDRPSLVDELTRQGINTCSAPSFRDDIQALRDHSAKVVERLSDFAGIPLGGGRVKLDRAYASILREATESGSVLVVGHPGSGKSGVMHDLAVALRSDGKDVVVLTAGSPPFQSLTELRAEIGLDQDLIDVLEGWHGDGPGFLLVDALDAVRTATGSAALHQLMKDVSSRIPRWHVVASVREYDARHGPEIRRIFSGGPVDGPAPSLAGPEFVRVRHLVVGDLTSEELVQLCAKAPTLVPLLTDAPYALTELLRNPFNLRLAAELIEAGTSAALIKGLTTQLELLDMYWDARVQGAGEPRDAIAREAVVRTVVEAMVQERALRVDRDLVDRDPSAGPHLVDLLSSYVLREWRGGPGSAPRQSVLEFAHHVLFDYAVARLLLRRSPERLSALLASDPGLILLARPSLVMHFAQLWEAGRSVGEYAEFWQTVLTISADDAIPEIGKLIAPSVAAGEFEDVDDLTALIEALGSDVEATQSAAANAFDHLVRSRLGAKGVRDLDTDLWANVLATVSASLDNGTAYPVRSLLMALIEGVSDLSPTAYAAVGATSRRLLEYAWSRPRRDRYLVVHSIQAVCRTLSSDAPAAEVLIRKAIESSHLAEHGHEELRWVADSVPDIASSSPDLVRDVYAAAFAYREQSEKPAPMGGIVLPLVSNRRQDYQGGLYALARKFPEFIRLAPQSAIQAAVAVLVAEGNFEDRPDTGAPFEVRYGAGVVKIRSDLSYIWDQGGRGRDGDMATILQATQSYLEECAEDGVSDSALDDAISYLLRDERPAVVVRTILRVAAKYPDAVGRRVWQLLSSPDVLRGSDTKALAGAALETTFPRLDAGPRRDVEAAIMAVPDPYEGETRRIAEGMRDQLLGCLSPEDLATPEAIARRKQLDDDGGPPGLPKDTSPISVWSGAYGEEEFLTEQGVDIAAEQNRLLRELAGPVKDFGGRFTNSVPDADSVAALLPQLRALAKKLGSASVEGVHEAQADYAWSALASAAAAVAKMEDLDCSDEIGQVTRDALLRASENRLPAERPDADAAFTKPVWSSPCARVEAAQGLSNLIGQAACADVETLAAVQRLASDHAPEVRYHVAIRVTGSYRRDPTWVWTMLGELAGDPSTGVLGGVVDSVYRLRFVDPQMAGDLTLQMYGAAKGREGGAEVRERCLGVLADLHLNGLHVEAARAINAIPSDVIDNLDVLGDLVWRLREVLIHGSVDSPEPQDEVLRRRALQLLTDCVTAAAEKFQRGLAASHGGDATEEHREEMMRTFATVLDSAGRNLAMAAGVHREEGAEPPDERVQARLLREAGPLLV